MKKITMILAALLFGAAGLFSQTYYVTVGWDEDECGCLDQGNSYYQVKVVIYDDANEVLVVTGTYVNVDFGTYTVNVNVPAVNTYCNDTHEYTPSFEVYAGATVYCDSYTPPEAICTTGSNLESDQTCAKFANNEVSIGPLYFD